MNEAKAKQADGASGADSGSGVPEIHAQESHRKYKLIDFDKSEIERTTAELFEGSKLLGNRSLWLENFRITIERIRTWCSDHEQAVQMAWVDVRSNKVLFYFVPKSDQYDLKLGGEMTDLEVELAGSAGIGYVETLQVPLRSLDRFAGQRSALFWQKEPA